MDVEGDAEFVRAARRFPRRGPSGRALARGAALSLALTHCDGPPSPQNAEPTPDDATPAMLATDPTEAPAGAESHADHDCRTAHPVPPPAAGPPAIALSAEARRALTTLRISAHVGAVILRRRDAGWVTAGEQGCLVPPARIERALDSLSALSAAAPPEPRAGAKFVLQIVAQSGEKPVLEFAVGDRNALGDLVELGDGSTMRVSGLDRELWSPEPDVWCSEP